MAEADDNQGFDILLEGDAGSEAFDWEDEPEAVELEQTVDVLRFAIGDQQFAVGGEYVREIVAEQKLTPVPGAPQHVRGVCVLRRQVVGVISLAEWLDPVREQEAGPTARIIIIEADPYQVGIEATEVRGLETWPAGEFDRSQIPDSINARTRRYALGVRMHGGQAVVLLDVARLIDDAAVD